MTRFPRTSDHENRQGRVPRGPLRGHSSTAPDSAGLSGQHWCVLRVLLGAGRCGLPPEGFTGRGPHRACVLVLLQSWDMPHFLSAAARAPGSRPLEPARASVPGPSPTAHLGWGSSRRGRHLSLGKEVWWGARQRRANRVGEQERGPQHSRGRGGSQVDLATSPFSMTPRNSRQEACSRYGLPAADRRVCDGGGGGPKAGRTGTAGSYTPRGLLSHLIVGQRSFGTQTHAHTHGAPQRESGLHDTAAAPALTARC